MAGWNKCHSLNARRDPVAFTEGTGTARSERDPYPKGNQPGRIAQPRV